MPPKKKKIVEKQNVKQVIVPDDDETELTPKRKKPKRKEKNQNETSSSSVQQEEFDKSSGPKNKVTKRNIHKDKENSDTENDEARDDDNDSCSDSESEEEIDENEKIIANNFLIHENAFQKEHDKFSNKFMEWVKTEIKLVLNGKEDDGSILKAVEEIGPKFIKHINDFIKGLNGYKATFLNMNHATVKSISCLYKVFVFCINEKKLDYNYNNFFKEKSFNEILSKYIKYYTYDRKKSKVKVAISSNINAVVTNEICMETIKQYFRLLISLLQVFDVKLSNECKSLFEQAIRCPLTEIEIKHRRKYADTEDIKWPFTPYDHNWLLDQYPIADKKGLTCDTYIATMNYLGFRAKTALAIRLNDITIFQSGRAVDQILISLKDLKECTEIKKVFIPGKLIPIDVAGLLILYLDSRKVFENGLESESPTYKIRKEFENEQLFVLPYTDKFVYKHVSEKLNAPRESVSARSSRKGHCVMHVLNTKTIYPAMHIKMLEEDLISGGTWSTKKNMRHYLQGGCGQIFLTCDRIEAIANPGPTFDATEHHLFLIDALLSTSDWNVPENDPAVKELEKKILQFGAIKTDKTTEYCQQMASAINFYRKVKETEYNFLPNIAIKVPPKKVNLDQSYCDGAEVFMKENLICEICKSVCIRDKPAIKKLDSTVFKYDKQYYMQICNKNDESDFEKKQAEQFAPNNENQQKCILKLFETWSLEQQ